MNDNKHQEVTKQSFAVEGMHCASCANLISRRLSKLPGVEDARVNYASETAVVTMHHPVPVEELNNAITPLGYTLKRGEEQSAVTPSTHHHEEQSSDMDTMLVTFPIAVFVFVLMLYDIIEQKLSFLPPIPIPMEFQQLMLLIVSSIVLFGFGRRYLTALFHFVQYRVANMDTLIGLGTGVAYIYSAILYLFPNTASSVGLANQQFFDVTIVVIGFISFGKYLESSSKKKTGEALEKLIGLQVKTAIRVQNGKQEEVSIDQIHVGDVLLVKPSTAIPIDGTILTGTTSIDESLVTGEPLPVDKSTGDVVIGSTMNMDGAITIRATKIGTDTVLARIIAQVKEAQDTKAPIERLADTISSIFVPTVLVISITSFSIWIFAGHVFAPSLNSLSMALQSAIGVLIIACPCALGLATPTAMIAAVGRGAGKGILIKDAESLERLARVDTVIVDKTGTLTEGKPTVVAEHGIGIDETALMQIAASLESLSEHPLSHAVTQKAQAMGVTLLPVSDFQSFPGMGISGSIQKKRYVIGNVRYMQEHGVKQAASIHPESYTPIFIAKNSTLIGYMFLGDTPKESAKGAVQSLHQQGVEVVMATGDTSESAHKTAQQLGISSIESGLSPVDKLSLIEKIKRNDSIVAMVGDGVNDAPALAASDIGIAMSTGTDVAIGTANITLLHGDIAKVSEAIQLSKHTMRIVKENLFWAFIYNIVGIPLAAGLLYPMFGITLNPVFAGVAMAMSSVSVVLNSLRLKTIRIS